MNVIFKQVWAVLSDDNDMSLFGAIFETIEGNLEFEQANGFLSSADELRAIADKIDELQESRHAE